MREAKEQRFGTEKTRNLHKQTVRELNKIFFLRLLEFVTFDLIAFINVLCSTDNFISGHLSDPF